LTFIANASHSDVPTSAYYILCLTVSIALLITFYNSEFLKIYMLATKVCMYVYAPIPNEVNRLVDPENMNAFILHQ
jgi:hypothetical protein